MDNLVIFGLRLVLLATVAPSVYAVYKRVAAREGELELWRVLTRRGLSVPDTAKDPRSLGVSVRRCTLCPSIADCRQWLASDARDGLEDFCPNAAYFKRLERS